MKLFLDTAANIIGYEAVGQGDLGTEFSGEMPDDFGDHTHDGYYRLSDGVIQKNPDYVAPTDPVVQPSSEQEAITALAQENSTLKAELSTVEQALTALATSQGGEK